MTIRRPLTIWITAACLFLVLIGTVKATVPADFQDYQFYYYYPDSSQANLIRLKQAMDNFLKESGTPLSFTSFARYNDFDRLTNENAPEFLLLPQWYFEENGNRLHLESLLVPYRNGQNFYKKVLLTAKKSNITLKSLTNKTLAVTSMGSNIDSHLNEKLFSHLNIDVKKLNVVATPKDSDALFALVLGHVDIALVGADNLDRIRKLNPMTTQLVKPLAETSPISLPVLCYRKGSVSPEVLDQVKEMFLRSNTKSYKIMEMLQIDFWKTYSN